MSRARGALGLAGALVLGASACGSGSGLTPTDSSVPRPAANAGGPPAVIPGRGSPAAWITRPTVLRASPGGRVLTRLRARTEFRSPRVLSVVGRRGPWFAVLAPELRNGSVGWIDARRFTRVFRVPYSLEVVLSRRTLTVRRLGRTVLTTPVAIGRPGSPTPRGRFAVTDKLVTEGGGSPYGCCALALTGHQPAVPQGWGGGDRLAIHATYAVQSIGQAASLGCMRTTNAVMKRLLREIPLGTPLRIRA